MATASHDRFLQLFLAHQSSLFAFIVANGVAPVDADDVLQNVAIVLWEKFADFQDGSNFRAWAFTVTRFEIRKQGDRWLRQQRVVCLNDDILDAMIEASESRQVADDDQMGRRLAECLAKLGGKARQLLAWYYGESLSHEDICARMKVTHGALRTRLCRIRKSLQTCLERTEAAS